MTATAQRKVVLIDLTESDPRDDSERRESGAADDDDDVVVTHTVLSPRARKKARRSGEQQQQGGSQSAAQLGKLVAKAEHAELGDGEDLAIVSITGQVTLRDLPHERPDCAEHKFKQGELCSLNTLHCAQCYCYVCDVKASECFAWGCGASAQDHCNAFKTDEWKRLRSLARQQGRPQGPATAAAAAVMPRGPAPAPAAPQAQPGPLAAAAPQLAPMRLLPPPPPCQGPEGLSPREALSAAWALLTAYAQQPSGATLLAMQRLAAASPSAQAVLGAAAAIQQRHAAAAAGPMQQGQPASFLARHAAQLAAAAAAAAAPAVPRLPAHDCGARSQLEGPLLRLLER